MKYKRNDVLVLALAQVLILGLGQVLKNSSLDSRDGVEDDKMMKQL